MIIVTGTSTNRYQIAGTFPPENVPVDLDGLKSGAALPAVGQSMTSTVSVMLAVAERLCHNVGNSVSLTEAHSSMGVPFFVGLSMRDSHVD